MRNWMLSIALLACTGVNAEEPTTELNENTLIFTGEVRNFIDIAENLKELTTNESVADAEKQMVEQVKILQLTSARIADAYFQESNAENRKIFSAYLAETLSSNKNLKNYFIIMGNAFATEGQRLIDSRQSNMHRIAVWTTVGGVVLGLAGGYLFFKYRKNITQAALVGVGIAVAAGASGYSARFVIPVNDAVKTAKDFIQRYPKGEDFINDVDTPSSDLAAIVDEVEGMNHDL